jgi:hypothetical protein
MSKVLKKGSGLGQNKKSHSKKTKKRLETKRQMLLARSKKRK